MLINRINAICGYPKLLMHQNDANMFHDAPKKSILVMTRSSVFAMPINSSVFGDIFILAYPVLYVVSR
jgi:hypothetical protein